MKNWFDVLVGSNLFGDILSDLGPAGVESIGIAPWGNLNPEREYPSMFEPVHGSAPDMAGKGIANPIGQIWSGAPMLRALALGRAIQVGIVAHSSPGVDTYEDYQEFVRIYRNDLSSRAASLRMPIHFRRVTFRLAARRAPGTLPIRGSLASTSSQACRAECSADQAPHCPPLITLSIRTLHRGLS